MVELVWFRLTQGPGRKQCRVIGGLDGTDGGFDSDGFDRWLVEASDQKVAS